MAEIASLPQQQPLYAAPQAQYQQQPLYAAAQAAPAAAAAAAQPAQATAQDHLYEALVKQITTGVGALPINGSKIREHITKYSSAPGGRAYLEDLLSSSNVEDFPGFITRPNTLSANGTLRTTWTKLELSFLARPKGQVTTGFTVDFAGSAEGIFIPSYHKFMDATFSYDDGAELDLTCTFKLKYYKFSGVVIVKFFNSVGKDFADLVILGAFNLPCHEIEGKGLMQTYH